MVNNSEKIREMLSFEDNDFYFVEVIKRRKDNPGLNRSEKVIRNYYIDSFESYDKIIPDLINVCKENTARAYIRVNKRNYEDLSLKILKRLADYISNKNYKAIRNVFDSVAGEFHSDKDKKWIVDIDWNEMFEYGNVGFTQLKLDLVELQDEAKKIAMVVEMPTMNGCHIVTRPFNLMKFRKLYPTIDIHKDNMLILVTF